MSTEQMHVLNLGVTGALVEASLPLPVNAEYRMQLVLEGDVAEATVKIRRVAMVQDARPSRYRIGLEFVALSPDVQELIQRLVASPRDGAASV